MARRILLSSVPAVHRGGTADTTEGKFKDFILQIKSVNGPIWADLTTFKDVRAIDACQRRTQPNS